MNKLKKLSLVLMLILILTACNVGDSDTGGENSKSKNETQNLENLNDTATIEDIEKETEEEDELNNGSEEERLSALMEKSDYISLVELSSTADNQMELRILTNFKGNLSNVEFQYPENLSPSKQYLIFYHDDEEGNITPTNGKNSMIEISGSDDSILQTIQGKYTVYEGDEAENSGKTNQRTTTKEDASKSND